MKILSFPDITNAFEFLDTINILNRGMNGTIYKSASIVAFDEMDGDGTPNVVITNIDPSWEILLTRLSDASGGKNINDQFSMIMGSAA